MIKFLRFCVCFSMLFAGVQAFAATKEVTCEKGYYLPASATGCMTCPTGYTCPGGTYTPGTTAQGATVTCAAGTQVIKVNGTCTTTTGSWYTSSHTVNYGDTSSTDGNVKSCLIGYATPSTSTQTDHDSSIDCFTTCVAGTQVTAANGACIAISTGNIYTLEHDVAQGATSTVNNCPTGYTISGSGQSYHDAKSDCTITCSAGYEVATADEECTQLNGSEYAARHTVSAGSTSGSNVKSCPSADSGWTRGSGKGWGAITDCFEYQTPTNCSSGSVKRNGVTSSTSAAGEYSSTITLIETLSAKAGYYASTTATSCSACTGRTTYSAAGATSCSTVSSGYYTTGCNDSGNNCTGQTECEAGNKCVSGVKTACSAISQYQNETGQTSCKSVADGYYKNGNTAVQECGIGAYCKSGARTLCDSSSLGSVSVPSGTYSTSTKTASASTECTYTAPSKTITGCATVTPSTVTYTGTAWPTSTYKVTANAGYAISNSGSASATCSKCTAGKYCTGGTAAAASCPSGYANSAEGSEARTDCYSDTKSRAWTGSQVDGATPTNCNAVTAWNACSNAACEYVAYSNADGTGDGTVKSGCETNNASCTKTAKTVTAKAGAYVNGTACTLCSAGTYQTTAGSSATSCTTADKGYFVASTGASSQTACSSLSGVSVTGGTYTTASTGSTKNTACTYTAPSKTITGCATVTPSTVTYTGTAWPTSTYKVTANAGYAISNSGSASATCSKCAAGNYCTGGTAAAVSCSTSTNGLYTLSAAGTTNVNGCYVKTTPGSQVQQSGGGQTSCTSGFYCAGGTTVYYGSTGGQTECIAPYNYSDDGASSPEECYLTTSSTKYVALSGAGETTCAAGGYCPGGVTVYYGSTGGRNECAQGSYTNTTGQTSCIACAGGKTNSGTGNTSCNSDCNAITGLNTWATPEWDADTNTVLYLCSIGTCKATYYQYATYVCNTCSEGTGGKYTNSDIGATSVKGCYLTTSKGKFVSSPGAGETNCTKNSYCPGGTNVYYESGVGITTGGRSTCPAGYPYSEANSILITECYSDTKNRVWTGSQVNGSIPTNCATVKEWGTCSNPVCTYVAYSNSKGTSDGKIKDGCETNNANCTKPVVSVTAKSGYYDAGTSCTSCAIIGDGTYQLSMEGNEGGYGACYKDCTKACTQPTSQCPANSTCVYSKMSTSGIQYYGGTCSAASSTCDITSYTCNSGYNQTSTGACEQLCGAGFTKIQTGTGLTIPLYANKLTSPAINIGYNNSVCYANLVAGAGAGLNVKYKGTTYHAVN